MSVLLDLPAEVRAQLVWWAFAFFIVGFFCGAVAWAWGDYHSLRRKQRGKVKGRYTLPCHAWLALLPVLSPAWLLPALLALGAVLVVGMGRGLKAEMGKVERRNGDGERGAGKSAHGPFGDCALGTMRPTRNPGALGTTRPTLYFTGGDPL